MLALELHRIKEKDEEAEGKVYNKFKLNGNKADLKEFELVDYFKILASSLAEWIKI